MPPLLKFHAWKLAGLLLAANFGLLAYLSVGDLIAPGQWNWTDIGGEGGSALLVLLWVGLLLKSRPAGQVTSLLFSGLACVFFSLWMDTLDEFIKLPDSISWDKWLESGPMPVGFILVTLGIYHWHREQLAISAQMEKREWLFREHRLFDKLTPLGGADYLRLQVQQALQQSRTEGQPLALVILDLDGFDRLNREHGHGEGDRVLQSLTQLLLLNLRRQDLLCRLAGDRFVALLPNTGAQQAQLIASELQDAVRHLAYRSARNGERLQLAAAVASVLAQDEDGDSLLKRLNLALARAKQTPIAKRA